MGWGDDLREKVLAAYAAGKGTLKELAERFGVSYGWVAKVHAIELRTGSRLRVPQRSRGRPSGIDAEMVRKLVKRKRQVLAGCTWLGRVVMMCGWQTLM